MEGEKEMKWQLATLYTLVILFRIKIKDEKNTYIFFYQKGLVMKKKIYIEQIVSHSHLLLLVSLGFNLEHGHLVLGRLRVQQRVFDCKK